MPQKMRWQGRVYSFNSLSYYHKRKVGRVMLHIFDVTDGSTDFRLICNPENLHWSLEEISNGTGS